MAIVVGRILSQSVHVNYDVMVERIVGLQPIECTENMPSTNEKL
jgi:hypothetical protein